MVTTRSRPRRFTCPGAVRRSGRIGVRAGRSTGTVERSGVSARSRSCPTPEPELEVPDGYRVSLGVPALTDYDDLDDPVGSNVPQVLLRVADLHRGVYLEDEWWPLPVTQEDVDVALEILDDPRRLAELAVMGKVGRGRSPSVYAGRARPAY